MISRVWYVTVYVRDFHGAVDFYQNMLGLPLKFADGKFGYASFETEGAGFSVARVDEDQASLVGRVTGIALAADDLNEEYEALVAKGVEFTMPPSDQPWGGRLATFADPEGNQIVLDQMHDR